MADAAVRADLTEALDRLGALAAEVALPCRFSSMYWRSFVTSSSVRSRTFVSGFRPSAAATLRAVGWPMP
jgi:hypothetical protein